MSDLIERQAAIDKIEELQMPIMRSASLIDQCKFDGLGMAREVLIELPSVTPEQKVGRWRPYKIEKKKIVFLDDLSKKDARQQQNWEDIYAPFYICSCCGKEDFSGNYCSNCGAKMEEVDE